MDASRPRALNDDHAELHRDAIRALKEAGDAIAAAAESGDDAVMLWLGQQVAAATMTLERDRDVTVLVLAAYEDGWRRRGEAMEVTEVAAPHLFVVA